MKKRVGKSASPGDVGKCSVKDWALLPWRKKKRPGVLSSHRAGSGGNALRTTRAEKRKPGHSYAQMEKFMDGVSRIEFPLPGEDASNVLHPLLKHRNISD